MIRCGAFNPTNLATAMTHIEAAMAVLKQANADAPKTEHEAIILHEALDHTVKRLGLECIILQAGIKILEEL